MMYGKQLRKQIGDVIGQLPADASVLDVGGGDERMIRLYEKALPGGHHHVLDPIRDRYLKARVKLGRAGNITYHNQAAADRSDQTSYLHFLRGFTDDPEPIRQMNGKAEILNVLISCQSIDQLFPTGDFQVIVFGQGGSIHKALQGAKALLLRCSPALIIDMASPWGYRPEQPRVLFQTLEELNYSPANESPIAAGQPSRLASIWGTSPQPILAAFRG